MSRSYGMHVAGSRGNWHVYDNAISSHGVLSFGFRTKREAEAHKRWLARASR